ncbi:MAG TPA: phosphoribosylglycinamide formyltransferase [Actinomycetota bacterium]|nr:phosphoribosylglycinamide formyltransferase [Actinomycetota bacterium]
MSGRIAVLISGTGSNMEALVRACNEGEVPGDVGVVVADRDCAGLKTAAELGIATEMIDFKAFGSREEWGEKLRAVVASYEPELVVSAGFMRLMPPGFVDAFSGRLINLHPSLLPQFPGAHGVRDALAAGVDTTGSTVHFVDYEVDHGPILLQEEVPIEPDDDERTLHERIKQVEHRLLPQACRLILEGKVTLKGRNVVVSS